MTTPSEQWIVSALREATDRMPLPPESRWIREPRTSRLSTIAVVSVAAILIVAIGMMIAALRVQPRIVPAAGPDAFAVAEDREWRFVRFVVSSDLVLLRPSWIPAEYRGSSECPPPWAPIEAGGQPGRSGSSAYNVEYRGRVQPGSTCVFLQLYGQLGAQDDPPDGIGLIETGTFDARGTTVHVQSQSLRPNPDRSQPLPQPILWHLWWNESGAHYDVLSNDPQLELVDVVRIVRSLEPMR